MKVQTANLTKKYRDQTVLDRFSMEIEDGELCCLMGPSGVGKTTLLRLLMGLEEPDGGSILFSGEQEGHTDRSRLSEGLCRHDRHCPDRKISAVFQENRLLPYADAVKNIRIAAGKEGLLYRPEDILGELLEEEAWYRPVRELSGGMQRRAAVARALAARSHFLMMDEPCTGLDEENRRKMNRVILKYRNGRTTLIVTHQEEDAAALGARIIRM